MADEGDRSLLEAELLRLQGELVKMQQWIRDEQQRLIVVFEGRDAAGKGGVIKRISEYLNPRWCRVAALPAPSDRERTEWYFQRYIAHLPAGGEIVVFDRSWYNRAGVERVMGFCTEDELQRFFRQCPAFERMLIDDGIVLVKYWFSVSDDEQERRFQARLGDPLKRWKLSSMDIEGRSRWVDYSRAKDDMFAHCDTPDSPWWRSRLTRSSEPGSTASPTCCRSCLIRSGPVQSFACPHGPNPRGTGARLRSGSITCRTTSPPSWLVRPKAR